MVVLAHFVAEVRGILADYFDRLDESHPHLDPVDFYHGFERFHQSGLGDRHKLVDQSGFVLFDLSGLMYQHVQLREDQASLKCFLALSFRTSFGANRKLCLLYQRWISCERSE